MEIESSQDEENFERDSEQNDFKEDKSETPTHPLQNLYYLFNLSLFDTEDEEIISKCHAL